MAVGLIQAIDDNDRNRKLVRGVLPFKGSVVTKAETGEAGIARPTDRFLGEVWVNERG
jgi:CheY-like chemotaxis protein